MNRIEHHQTVSPMMFPFRPGPCFNEEENDLSDNPALEEKEESPVLISRSVSSLDALMSNVQARVEKLAMYEDGDKSTLIIKKKPKRTTTEKTRRNKPSASKTRRGGTKQGGRHKAAVDAAPSRRDNVSCDSSVSSIDSADPPPPRKHKMDLRPHKSVDLYHAQRKDETLRQALRENPRDYTVKQVHGRKLVFHKEQDNETGATRTRIYIPESLQQVTRDYYFSKYSLHPMKFMRETCYWPTMEKQERRRFQWAVHVTGKDIDKVIYDSDDSTDFQFR